MASVTSVAESRSGQEFLGMVAYHDVWWRKDEVGREEDITSWQA